jgi:hypothetical protein
MIGASTVIWAQALGAVALKADLARLGGEDRVFQHGLVQLEADLADMARLFVTKQVARAANVEVVAGQLETGAQRVQIAQHLQALFGGVGHALARRRGEIGIGAQLRTPDAPAKLVQLREAEAVRAMDDDRVGRGNIDPAFHDGGGEQHVIFALIEGAHALFHLAGRHLAMGGNIFDLRHIGAQPFLDLGHVGDAGDDDKALPAAMVFAQQASRITISSHSIT